ncbi:MAG: type II secretion system protein GspD [bacterium]
MRIGFLTILIFLFAIVLNAQNAEQRIRNIENKLESLQIDSPGLSENVTTDINVTNISLANFLLAISNVHELNVSAAPELDDIMLTNNFPNVTVKDLLVFLCKEYSLDIEFTGNILAVKKYKEPSELEKHELRVLFQPQTNLLSIDAQGESLSDVFKLIMDETGKNLLYTPNLGNLPLNVYILDSELDIALDKLALANNLVLEKTKDNFYVFDSYTVVPNGNQNGQTNSRPRRNNSANFSFSIQNLDKQILKVDFINTPIATIIEDISAALNLNIFTATPLDNAGFASFKADKISFDDLLVALFEAQVNVVSSSNPIQTNDRRANSAITQGNSEVFTFKKDGNIYYFGTESQLSVRTVDIIQLKQRAISLLNDPLNNVSPYGVSGVGNNNGFPNSNGQFNQFDNFSNQNNRQPLNTQVGGNFNSYENEAEALVNILPDELKNDLDIKIDFELNSFYVNGPSAKVERFKEFVKKIDKPVPVVLIEVMIIEVNRSATVDAGVNWGIGTEPTQTQGDLFPETNLTLGAPAINRLIGSFNDFTGFNLGRVGPNFFANIRALESNGDLKVKSTPRLATLNSHKAILSNSQTSFYAITQRNIYGTDNPQTSEITNYYPIDAELSLIIKPSVTGNGKVILDVGVIQSSFGGRIAEDAPPDINSRSFSSILAMNNQDVAILGGIEEQYTNNTGSGVPFLARIPVIKWLFSRRVREGRKSKLTVLIKPTIIN